MTKNSLVGKIQKNEERMKEDNLIGRNFQINSEKIFCINQNITFQKQAKL